MDRSGAIVKLRLEGRLTGPWVQELDRCWAELLPEQQRGAVADLTDVTFIGEDGRQLLVKLWKQGAVFQAADCLTRSIVDAITVNDPRENCTG